ncbi:hypothetical protein Dimus_031294 [Dionaea muscipula]
MTNQNTEEHRQAEMEDEETTMQQLRSKATELLIREEWRESVQAYSVYISLCQDRVSSFGTRKNNSDPDHLSNLRRSLCLSLSNRAEARSRLRDFEDALEDCELALEIESTHHKTLVCKGKILLFLDRYSAALECFERASLDPNSSGHFVGTLNGFIEKCKKLESLSRNGGFDVSDWVLSGFRGKCPEFAEFVGSVEINKSEISGRGVFATKNIDAGGLIFVTRAVATGRCILPRCGNNSGENAQLVMWKDFIDKVTESASKCPRTHYLIDTLSTGEGEDELLVPDISLFLPGTGTGTGTGMEKLSSSNDLPHKEKMLSILDVNSFVEDAVSAIVLGKNSDYYGIGLWLLPSFINHSCSPNARRLHIGDHVIVHASRDVKKGEEITLAYFDVLSPLNKRKEMAETWGFSCDCKRCKFEKKICSRPEIEEIEMGLERGLDRGSAIFRLEEYMRMWMVRGKEKGYLRAAFWATFSEAYQSEKTASRWGRRVPALEAVVDSIFEAVGSDDRVLKILIERLKKRKGCNGVMDVEKVLKLGRGLYGKVMKKQALRKLLELGIIY